MPFQKASLLGPKVKPFLIIPNYYLRFLNLVVWKTMILAPPQHKVVPILCFLKNIFMIYKRGQLRLSIKKSFTFGPKSEAFWKSFAFKVKLFKKASLLGPKAKPFEKLHFWALKRSLLFKSEAFSKSFAFKVKLFE